jgi:hypothetical protein
MADNGEFLSLFTDEELNDEKLMEMIQVYDSFIGTPTREDIDRLKMILETHYPYNVKEVIREIGQEENKDNSQ